jgi:hypothetical protein
MKLSKSDAQDLVSNSLEGFTEISDEIISTSRWSVYHTFVCKCEASGKFWRVDYSRGATEYQDESPFEYEDEVEFEEVFPVEVKAIMYMTEKERANHEKA